ncbi:GM19622 [Drosophila sechellia]|uniref:GM19622 n=1 Tax=Drosophila sechellia TaxID=7238 RepID=B4IIN7_DROSE|nr:GM19622 [Drosophila sechellia]
MPISQHDLGRLASAPSSKSNSSNTYLSYSDLDLGSKSCGGVSLRAEPSCNHWKFCEKVPNRSDVEADSLGSPVGLVCSNATVNNPCGSSPKQEEANILNFATYLKAFALIYVLPETDWTAEKIDMLLEEGTELFRASSDVSQGHDDPDENKLLEPEIYTNEEKRIKRNFNLEGHTFTLALEPRYLGVGSKPLDQQPPHTIKNLGTILQNFFKSSRYCLLLTRVGHLLIWRRKRVFFVLDVKGRAKDDLATVKDNGVAMLVCLKSIDNVVHLASNLSGISPRDEFSIRELVVVRLETPDGRIYMRDTSHRSIEFKVVNKSYAYLKGTLHLSLNRDDPVRNRSSLMVAVGSVLASKIDHPANWDTNMLDRLISYGVELCRNCWADCLRDRRPIDLDTFPTQLRMGQFVLELKLIPNVRTGHWRCGVRIIGTEFEAHVSQALKERGNVVFQINNQMYAIWLKDGFYYLVDPYRHTIVGTHVAEDKAEGAKWATVRMFRDQLTMLSVFHQLLKESNRQSAYYVHVVRIRNLAECPEGYALVPMPDGKDNCEVKSLNETILFNDQQCVRVCNKTLAEISDYEEDVVSLLTDKSDIDHFQILDEQQNAGAECEFCEEEFRTESLKRLPKNKTTSSKSRVGLSKREQDIKDTSGKRQTGGTALSPSPEVSSLRYRSKEDVTSGKIMIKSENTKDSGSPVKPHLRSKSRNRSPGKCSPRRTPSSKMAPKVDDSKGGNAAPDLSIPKEAIGTQVANKEASNRKGALASKGVMLLRKVNMKTITAIEPSKNEKKEETPTHILQQSVDKSKCLGVAPLAAAHLNTPAASNFVNELDQMEKPPSPKMNVRNAEQYIEQPKNSCCRGADEDSMEGIGSRMPVRFPGFSRVPQLLAVAGSESGTVESLNRVLGSAFKVANRVLTMTPWGNYVVFRHHPTDRSESAATWFYVFDGCTCDIDRFRHLDLSTGTAGLIAFRKQSEVVCHIIDSREEKAFKMLRSGQVDPPRKRIQRLLAH